MKAHDLVSDFFQAPGFQSSARAAAKAIARGHWWIEAEDLLQTAVLEILKPDAGVRATTREELLALLRTKTRLRFIDFKKRERRRVPFGAVPEPEDRRAGDPLDEERRGLVRSAISKLTAKDQRLFRLRYLEGLSIKEMARRLNASPAAVEKALARIRARVRILLEGDLVFKEPPKN